MEGIQLLNLEGGGGAIASVDTCQKHWGKRTKGNGGNEERVVG